MFISEQNIFKLSKPFADNLVLEAETHRLFYQTGTDSIFDFIKFYCNM